MRLGTVLENWRTFQRKHLTTVAKDIGIYHATLKRFEEGGSIPAEALVKIVKWLCEEESNGSHGQESGSEADVAKVGAGE